MRRIDLTITATLLLTGCASVSDFQPYAPLVRDGALYTADQAFCRAVAQGYSPGVSVAGIGAAGGKAGLQNAPAAVVSPLVVGVAALGAASGEALDEAVLTGAAQIHIYVDCLKRVTDKDGSAFVADPN